MFKFQRMRGIGPIALGMAIPLFALPVTAEVPVGPPVFSNPLDFDNTYFPFEPGAFKVMVGHEMI